jgi:hypothetical protein
MIIRPSSCILLAAVLLAAYPAYAEEPSHLGDDLGLGPASNQATITQIGQDQRATIEQHNIAGGLLTGAIKQRGSGNEASMLLEGGNLAGSILQRGNDNDAALEVRDQNNRGAIKQYGNSNSGGLKVDGYGQDVTLIQQGGVQIPGAIRIGGDTPGGLPVTIRQR